MDGAGGAGRLDCRRADPIAAYFVGVALLGAGVGALAASLIWAALGREPHALVVILFAIAGALVRWRYSVK